MSKNTSVMQIVSVPEIPTVFGEIPEYPVQQGIIDSMLETMRENKGIGLSSNQVGLKLPLFVGHLTKKSGPFVVCEPYYKILNHKIEVEEEGCLSLPGVRRKVPRWKTIQLYGRDEKGVKIDWICKGLLARLVQHECDHLMNRLITAY